LQLKISLDARRHIATFTARPLSGGCEGSIMHGPVVSLAQLPVDRGGAQLGSEGCRRPGDWRLVRRDARETRQVSLLQGDRPQSCGGVVRQVRGPVKRAGRLAGEDRRRQAPQEAAATALAAFSQTWDCDSQSPAREDRDFGQGALAGKQTGPQGPEAENHRLGSMANNAERQMARPRQRQFLPPRQTRRRRAVSHWSRHHSRYQERQRASPRHVRRRQPNGTAVVFLCFRAMVAQNSTCPDRFL